MKKAIIFCALLFFTSVTPLYAHPIFPNSIVQYLSNNPDATQEEFERYAKENAPEFAENYKNIDDVRKLLKAETNFFDNSLDFIKLGITHILEGTDHILFLVSLLLIFVSFEEVLRLTSTFTIAHSITIFLAGASLLTLTPRIVEPIIAFSISYVAATTVFLSRFSLFEKGKSKIIGVFIFGLFHGLGFAGLLQEVQLPKERFVSSLIAFNIGIEIGQLIIVAAILPFIYFFRNKKWYGLFIKIIAGIITILGIIWGIQRLFQ